MRAAGASPCDAAEGEEQARDDDAVCRLPLERAPARVPDGDAMTTIMTKPVQLGATKLHGDVAVLDIDGVDIGTPTRAKPWFKINVRAALPPEGCPSATDVQWLLGATLYVLAVFPNGTFDVQKLAERPEPSVTA